MSDSTSFTPPGGVPEIPVNTPSVLFGDDYYLDHPEADFDPDLWLYRERTIALLRRYVRIALEVGRLPSLLGRELFRSKVTSYHMSTFEDGVIFVHDVEQILDQLAEFQRRLIATIVFQEYTQDEAAEVLRCTRRTVCREFPAALDRITELFLAGGLLNALPARSVENFCQGGPEGDFSLSDCKQAE